jgi:hypothetical protein
MPRKRKIIYTCRLSPNFNVIFSIIGAVVIIVIMYFIGLFYLALMAFSPTGLIFLGVDFLITKTKE